MSPSDSKPFFVKYAPLYFETTNESLDLFLPPVPDFALYKMFNKNVPALAQPTPSASPEIWLAYYQKLRAHQEHLADCVYVDRNVQRTGLETLRDQLRSNNQEHCEQRKFTTLPLKHYCLFNVPRVSLP